VDGDAEDPAVSGLPAHATASPSRAGRARAHRVLAGKAETEMHPPAPGNVDVPRESLHDTELVASGREKRDADVVSGRDSVQRARVVRLTKVDAIHESLAGPDPSGTPDRYGQPCLGCRG
jgi:hypothetical protein